LRDFNKFIIDSYTGKDYLFPQGELVGLQFKILNGSYWRTLFSSNTLTFHLDITAINSIKGNLENLEIVTDTGQILLGKTIKVNCDWQR
ncbi:MAG TPA: hypothetical protein VHS53_01770, partial [Mucilaginibacter sp.]|nr:hypothetical protein [Mucilaginibacter sp.]